MSYRPLLETERLLLRPFVGEDLEHLARLNGDREVMRYITDPISKEQAKSVLQWFLDRWRRLNYGWFAVFEKESDRFIGQCGLQPLEGELENPETELCYAFHREFWGRGLATEAAIAVAEFGFVGVGKEYLVAACDREHRASQRVLEKVGFKDRGDRFLYDRTVAFYQCDRSSFKQAIQRRNSS